MTGESKVEQSGNRFVQTLSAAAALPGVRINREQFLRSALARHCTPEQIDLAVAQNPAAAGVSDEVVKRIANASINQETSKVSTLSAAAGLPGGIALLGTVPADLAQYLGHVLRVIQKQAYIYSWPDLFDGKDMDEETQNLLVLFTGVMFGANAAQVGVQKVSTMLAQQAVKQLPRQALTRGVIYPIVRKVALKLGVQMNKQIFAGGVAKAIPVAGAVLSGGLTLATFLPMSKRLQRHLSSLEIAHTRPLPSSDDIVDEEPGPAPSVVRS